MASPHLDDLNPAQREAATFGIEGGPAVPTPPLLVVAGAGTGKTGTLAHRVAHLVLSGADPRRVLLLTFTRRAAEGMARRAGRIRGRALGTDAPLDLEWAGTFHGVGARFLRLYAPAIGLDPAFTVLDRGDAADLLDLVRDGLGLARTDRRFPRKATCLAAYSAAVNTARPLAAVLADAFPWCAEWHDDLRRLFATYVAAKQRQGVLDYDDLLLWWEWTVRVPEIVADAGGRFDHVPVDEYQGGLPLPQPERFHVTGQARTGERYARAADAVHDAGDVGAPRRHHARARAVSGVASAPPRVRAGGRCRREPSGHAGLSRRTTGAGSGRDHDAGQAARAQPLAGGPRLRLGRERPAGDPVEGALARHHDRARRPRPQPGKGRVALRQAPPRLGRARRVAHRRDLDRVPAGGRRVRRACGSAFGRPDRRRAVRQGTDRLPDGLRARGCGRRRRLVRPAGPAGPAPARESTPGSPRSGGSAPAGDRPSGVGGTSPTGAAAAVTSPGPAVGSGTGEADALSAGSAAGGGTGAADGGASAPVAAA